MARFRRAPGAGTLASRVPDNRDLGVARHGDDRLRLAAAAENNELVGELNAAVARAERLQSLTDALGDALTTPAVADLIVAMAPELLGTAYATVMLMEADGRSVRFLRLQPVPDRVARLMSQIPAGARSATGDAMALREPVFHRNLDEYLGDYPHLREATEALGVKALAHLPLVAGPRLLGVLSLSWWEERQFEADERRFLTTVAGQCALATQRAELFEQKSEVATILQRAILPGRLPRSARLAFAARYLAAETDIDVGGDWYDAFPGPDDRVWFSVGDVAGHGPEAASVMGQLRNAMRALAYAGLEPSGLMDVVDCLLSRAAEGPAVATAIVAVGDPATGRVTWSNAGHLPPLLLPAAGAPSLIDERHGPLLGVDRPGRRQGTIELDVKDVLLFYTDGLVENRGEPLEAGLARLVESAHHWSADGGPGAVADHALATSLGGGARLDDLCVLAVQRQG